MPDLKKYIEKRNFGKSPEPPGKVRQIFKHSFVIQKHKATRLHYDLRLEVNGVLKSWAVPKGPSLNSNKKRLAILVEDHPVEYAGFEGIIPEGNYGAGNVIVWDKGKYVPIDAQTDQEITEKLNKGHLSFILNGEKLKGEFTLTKFGNEENNWLLIKKKDEFASDEDIKKKDKSVISGKTIDQLGKEENQWLNLKSIKKGKMPHQVSPMLSTLIDKPFNSKDWIFEIKWDGYRTIAEIKNSKVKLYSRNNVSFNQKFSPVLDSLSKINQDAVLDGEVVVLNEEGKPNFQLLQNYQKDKKGILIYYVFDILHLNGHDLTNTSLIERKKILKDFLPELSFIEYNDHIEENGRDLFEIVKKQNIEGIIGKRKDSAYLIEKRSKDWVKIKNLNRQEAIICGFTEGRGGRKNFGALVLGAYNNNELVYIGHTGGGFNEKNLKDIRTRLNLLVQKEPPFKTPPKTNMPVTWVKPMLVCEVKFSEWTSDLKMRQPIFLGLREDKRAEDVVIEKTDDGKSNEKQKNKTIQGKVSLSNLDKVFWPEEGYTKEDLINYYNQVSDVILPYLIDRPQSLHRFPDGIYGESFYQKNIQGGIPKWIKTIKIQSESKGKKVRYFLCQNKDSLTFLINFGCIDLNPWSSRIQKLNHPDYLIMDLDPVKIEFDYVIEAALKVKEVLDKLQIKGYPKTSGKRGIHILVPTEAKYNYDQIKDFSKIIAGLTFQKSAGITSLERSPSKRERKVYLDFLQNVRGQTIASAYSIRPYPKATVSTPITWKELEKGLKPTDFTIRNIPKRLSKIGDIFKPVLGRGIDLSEIIKKYDDF